MSKILIIGDVFAKPGRWVLSKTIPELKKELTPDLIVANVENLAHGKGVTDSTLSELKSLGVDVFTSGNHVFDKLPEAVKAFEKYPELIRPMNYGNKVPGRGFVRFEKNGQNYFVMNLGGQVFFENQYKNEIQNPFLCAKETIDENAREGDIIIVDFHAEATSEKIALAWFLSNRATVVYGTHTHVPSYDFRILLNTTAFASDVGMTGVIDSVIGVKYENALKVFLNPGERFILDPAEEGLKQLNALWVETYGNRPVKIERIQKNI